ncbi:hypothetical protein K9M16_05100 [Candidatus Babeliales bacterium]|nr:hypothetical protein [Candidatus Babeliales bacterium]MCF7910752.1 hypothetical protein [Candidatus Pacearchaeota archaeon]
MKINNISELLGLTKYGDTYRNLGGEDTKIYAATANLMDRLGHSLREVSGRIERVFEEFREVNLYVENPQRIIKVVNKSLHPDYFVAEGASPLNRGIAIAQKGVHSGSEIEAITTFGEGEKGDFAGIDSQGQRIELPIINVWNFLQLNKK